MLVTSLADMAKSLKREPKGYLLAFDPGETTGFAQFFETTLQESAQLDTSTVLACRKSLHPIFDRLRQVTDPSLPIEIVIEDYRIYEWKAKDHSWSAVHTVKVVGILEYLCLHWGVPYTLRLAQQAKGFMKDDKLKSWGLWKEGQRHARDAIRHGAYHILFGKDAGPTGL